MGAKFIYQHRYWQIVNFRVAFQSQSFHLKISFIHMQMNQNVHVKKRVSVMRRTYKRGTKTRGGSHAIVNRKKTVCCAVLRYIPYAQFSQMLEVLWDSHRLFGSRNRPPTGIYSPYCPPCVLERVARRRS